MTKDEALNLALDAFKTLMIERGSIYDKAITAIKEALAQPEQEPVAILHRYPSKCRMTVEYTDEITEVREGSWPLYTTQPQRKPLTDEEIRLQWSEFWETECHPWAIQFARAIEAAHGIKE